MYGERDGGEKSEVSVSRILLAWNSDKIYGILISTVQYISIQTYSARLQCNVLLCDAQSHLLHTHTANYIYYMPIST